ncbi:MAG: ribonuclease Y [Armatimonadetes bacterium]|nr:ribonuclease Y [Armatimonadota bacterium]
MGCAGALSGLGFAGWGTRRCRLREAALRDEEERLRVTRAEVEKTRAEALLEARDSAESLRRRAEDELRDRRAELQRLEERLIAREDSLEQRAATLERRDADALTFERSLHERAAALAEAEAEGQRELERRAELTAAEARELVLQQAEGAAREHADRLARKLEDEVRREAERRARRILALAIERCAVDHVTETSVAVVPLSGDDVKGRIIGREGRNIRCFEQLTGVDLVIDDTPEAVVISAFDPLRRELARMALELLVADGRIHPTRIEEVVGKCRAELGQQIHELGEQAAREADVAGLAPELLTCLGRLHFRTSYGQNVLRHSVEVAHLVGLMAAELGADERVARRAGLLHDIGKTADSGAGPHALGGTDLARAHGESPEVCEAIGAHHGEVEAAGEAAALVLAADAVSAARPGARRDSLEHYVQRLERLESLAAEFPGVERVYAMQAGRELRVLVRPNEVSDDEALALAKGIAGRIETELAYPGQIKVTVIREHRAVEYAN